MLPACSWLCLEAEYSSVSRGVQLLGLVPLTVHSACCCCLLLRAVAGCLLLLAAGAVALVLQMSDTLELSSWATCRLVAGQPSLVNTNYDTLKNR